MAVPPKARERMMEELHETHPGIWHMKYLARSHVSWPKMDSELEMKVQSCNVCQVNRKLPPEAPLHPWEWPHKPWVRLHLDYAGPFLGKMFLTVVDVHSKWRGALPMSTSTSEATIEKLRIAFSTHGLPEMVVTDNGSNFVSKELEAFLKQNGIRHIKTAPYYPSSNGLAERAVQTFKEGMKKLKDGSLETRVSRFLSRYRITPQTSTGVSSAELLLGRKPRSRLDLAYPDISRKVPDSQWSRKQRHDLHVKEHTMMKGAQVYARNFSQGPKWVPGILLESNGPIAFEVELEDGRMWRRHQDHVIHRASDPPLPTQSEVLGSIPSQLEKTRPSIQPMEDHAASAVMNTSAAAEQSDVQMNAERHYPVRNRHAPPFLSDFVSK